MVARGIFIKHKPDLSFPAQNLPWLPSTLRKKFQFLITSHRAWEDPGSLAGAPVQFHLLPCAKLCLSHLGLFLPQMLLLCLFIFCSFCLEDALLEHPFSPCLFSPAELLPPLLGLSSDASSCRTPSLNPKLGEKLSVGS